MIILVKEITRSKRSACTALRLRRQNIVATLNGGIFSLLSAGPLPVLTEGVVLGLRNSAWASKGSLQNKKYMDLGTLSQQREGGLKVGKVGALFLENL